MAYNWTPISYSSRHMPTHPMHQTFGADQAPSSLLPFNSPFNYNTAHTPSNAYYYNNSTLPLPFAKSSSPYQSNPQIFTPNQHSPAMIKLADTNSSGYSSTYGSTECSFNTSPSSYNSSYLLPTIQVCNLILILHKTLL